MLDIKFIRENKDLVKHAAKMKQVEFDVEKLIEVDDRRRELQQKFDEKRALQNSQGALLTRKETIEEQRQKILADLGKVKEEMKEAEEKLKEVMSEWRKLMISVPNIPDVSVPEGKSEADNKEVKKWGKIPKFDFTPKSHIELMESLDMVDLERGIKVAGFRGYFLKNDGAILSFAVWQAALDHFLSKKFTPIIVPSLIKRETLLGTGYLPQGEEDLYKTQDGEYLAGTAEVATMAMHSGEILDKKDLPKKYLAFSPCFRREAGAHGKDVKGLIRVHEFYKVEQVVLCEANHEESVKYHEELNRNTEEFIEKLEIPYRTVINCGADLGLGQVKKYDIELWVPGENTYREIGSTSYFHDFQTRRLNIRHKDGEGKLKFVHSLNSTAIPTPRLLVSLVENYQQADGSIKIPEALQKYMGGKEKIGK